MIRMLIISLSLLFTLIRILIFLQIQMEIMPLNFSTQILVEEMVVLGAEAFLEDVIEEEEDVILEVTLEVTLEVSYGCSFSLRL